LGRDLRGGVQLTQGPRSAGKILTESPTAGGGKKKGKPGNVLGGWGNQKLLSFHHRRGGARFVHDQPVPQRKHLLVASKNRTGGSGKLGGVPMVRRSEGPKTLYGAGWQWTPAPGGLRNKGKRVLKTNPLETQKKIAKTWNPAISKN